MTELKIDLRYVIATLTPFLIAGGEKLFTWSLGLDPHGTINQLAALALISGLFGSYLWIAFGNPLYLRIPLPTTRKKDQ
jgi:hypothetical protein